MLCEYCPLQTEHSCSVKIPTGFTCQEIIQQNTENNKEQIKKHLKDLLSIEFLTDTENDNIHRPKHYGTFTPIDAMASGLINETELKGYLKGNLLKYITRFEYKNGVEDLEKAQEYLTLLIKYEKGENIIGE